MLPARLHFGECLLDRDARTLHTGGRPVHLTPKAFQLLELLLEARPRVVRKLELRDRLWPDCHVSNATVTAVVAELRAAIGADARTGRLIRTAHGIGYAFAGAVARVVDRSSAGAHIVWAGHDVEVFEGECLMGRAPDCAIRLHDRRVSRHHARLVALPNGLAIEDCGSRHGTQVNGIPVAGRVLLRDQDVISVGGLDLCVDMPGAGTTSTLD